MRRTELEGRLKKLGWFVWKIENNHRYWWHPHRGITLAVPFIQVDPGDDGLILNSIAEQILADAER